MHFCHSVALSSQSCSLNSHPLHWQTMESNLYSNELMGDSKIRESLKK
jgi:hypothetical protein